MEHTADKIKGFQDCISNLISALALPAIWSGIVSTLLDALVGMLRLDFAYARLCDAPDGSPAEMVCLAQRRRTAPQAREVGRSLARWLTGDPSGSPIAVLNPVGDRNVSIVPLRLGLQDEVGVLVAGSRRVDFPATTDMLIIRVAANQAVIGLQEARLLSEQKRMASALEQRVAERTQRLEAANRELGKDTLECKQAEARLLALRDQLAAELSAITRLQDFITRLVACTALQPLLEEVLNATISLQHADFGNVQLYNSDSRVLEVVAQHGFQADFLEYFGSLHEDTSAYGRALQRQERVIVVPSPMLPPVLGDRIQLQ